MVEALKGADMVFVTAGDGRSTRTGLGAGDRRGRARAGALTVGVVTPPFGFEGGGAPSRPRRASASCATRSTR